MSDLEKALERSWPIRDDNLSLEDRVTIMEAARRFANPTSPETIEKAEGVVLCLAHSSVVSGDQEICERVEGDLPPELDDDEMMCGPFSDVWIDMAVLRAVEEGA